jgi:hypothetical protein
MKHGELHGPLLEPSEELEVWCSCEDRPVPAEDEFGCCTPHAKEL